MKKLVFTSDLHISSTTPGSRIDNYTLAIFNKFEWVLDFCKRNDAILVLGGDVFHTPAQPDYIKNDLTRIIKKYDVKVYAIFGNHDLLFYNEKFVDRTSLGLMFESNWISRIDNNLLDNWDLVCVDPRNIKEDKFSQKTIIVSHAYLDSAFPDKLFFEKGFVENCNARFLLLGHDHNQYKPINIGNTTVVRPGAISRGTSNSENSVRVISVALIDLDKNTVKYIPVEGVSKFEEVFKDKYEPDKKEIISFSDIRDFIDKLKNSNISISPYDLLADMDISETVRDRCEKYLEGSGILKNSPK